MLSLRDAMQQLVEGSVIRPGTWLGGTATSHSFPLNVCGTAEELHSGGAAARGPPGRCGRQPGSRRADHHGQAAWPRAAGGQQWYLQEFQPGQFSRSFALPFPVEHEQVTAHYTNGVLTLTLPKAEAAKPKRISIGTGQAQPHSTARPSKRGAADTSGGGGRVPSPPSRRWGARWCLSRPRSFRESARPGAATAGQRDPAPHDPGRRHVRHQPLSWLLFLSAAVTPWMPAGESDARAWWRCTQRSWSRAPCLLRSCLLLPMAVPIARAT